MKQQRIYLVGQGQTMRLVRATHRAQALGHVARKTINVKVASQDELVHALASGVSIEAASEPDTKELFEDGAEQQQAA